mgnify:FL=1
MKKIVFILLFLCNMFVFAQTKGMFSKSPIINLENWDKQRTYWGYFLGFNSYDFKFEYENYGKDILVNKNSGFNVGLIGDLRLFENLNLRFEPGLYFTQRNLTFTNITDPNDALREVKSTYIHLPLLLKFSAKRTGNIRPFLVGGVSRTLNLSSNSNLKDDNEQEIFRVTKWTNNYELGFGIDLYTEYFKFTPSIRGVFGMGDELVRDNSPTSPWTSNVNSMSSRAIFINFTFQ